MQRVPHCNNASMATDAVVIKPVSIESVFGLPSLQNNHHHCPHQEVVACWMYLWGMTIITLGIFQTRVFGEVDR